MSEPKEEDKPVEAAEETAAEPAPIGEQPPAAAAASLSAAAASQPSLAAAQWTNSGPAQPAGSSYSGRSTHHAWLRFIRH